MVATRHASPKSEAAAESTRSKCSGVTALSASSTGGGVAISNGSVYVDVSYRFRKFLDTGKPINVSGFYAGVGVGF